VKLDYRCPTWNETIGCKKQQNMIEIEKERKHFLQLPKAKCRKFSFFVNVPSRIAMLHRKNNKNKMNPLGVQTGPF